MALRTIGDREEAADAVQDALLSAHRAAARFRGDSAVTTWLHRIVVNACLDRIRRRQAHPTVPLPDGSRSETARTGAGAGGTGTGPRHRPGRPRRARRAPAEQRAALVLVDVQGYPVAEAAVILGVAEGTVKSRCARGRARMAVTLGHLRERRETSVTAGQRREPRGHRTVPSLGAVANAPAIPAAHERGDSR